GQAVTSALDTARRIAARGGDAVVVIDSLDALPAGVARRALATARNLTDSGSVTVIATSAEPVGIETTLITLDPAAARAGLPALDLGRSGTMHDGLLLTKAAVAKNLKERAAALGVAAPTVDAGPDAVATPAAAKPAAKKRAAKKPAAKRAPVKRPDARTKPELA
ncbi:MAG TPA: hypothetical protein VNT22_01390, partial [Baekduia sp.]|nr:hypothetical protein [Baekduia sp.]